MASIEVIQGDITKIVADAIVNAANAELVQGGGVCGAIFRAAGPEKLAAACRAIGTCATGSAVITPSFGITTARYIVHAVGPVYASVTPERARELLRSAYTGAIAVAADNGCRSIAFPAISTGVYGYPLDAACRVAVDACRDTERETGFKVMLVAFDARTADALRSACSHQD
jgi:O-acetyl-ADP-ribose deacetylase (regulator of RNase III)